MLIRIVLEPSEEGGYTAIAPSLPGCISEGNSREEAIENIREAIELYLEPVEDQGDFVLAFPCINIKQLTINLDKCLRTKYIYPPMRLRSGGSSVEPVGNQRSARACA